MTFRANAISIEKNARIVGALFLIAMVASLLGGTLVEDVLSAPDYLVAISENETQVLVGVLLELINGLAVVGIGVLMFPILREHSDNIALGYLGLRIIEAGFCCVIVISPLSIMTLSQAYLTAGSVDMATFQIVRSLAVAERAAVANLLIPVFLSLGALLLYYLLYRSHLLPRYIAVWGFMGAVLILALNLLLTFNIDVGNIVYILVIPLITNEIFLGIWLVVKGFRSEVIASTTA